MVSDYNLASGIFAAFERSENVGNALLFDLILVVLQEHLWRSLWMTREPFVANIRYTTNPLIRQLLA